MKCANCKGEHAAASPRCPKYIQVKEAWKTVALDKLTYAEAMRKVTGKTFAPNPAIGSRPSRPDRDATCSRADATEATGQRRNWATKQTASRSKPEMCSIETQTDPEPITVMTQTTLTREAESQTNALPEEKAVQVQTTKETETQTLKVEVAIEQDDKYIATTFLFVLNMLVKHANESLGRDAEYANLKKRYNETMVLMGERGYPLAPTLAEAARLSLSKGQKVFKK